MCVCAGTGLVLGCLGRCFWVDSAETGLDISGVRSWGPWAGRASFGNLGSGNLGFGGASQLCKIGGLSGLKSCMDFRQQAQGGTS